MTNSNKQEVAVKTRVNGGDNARPNSSGVQ
jgi:hypothetical protein